MKITAAIAFCLISFFAVECFSAGQQAHAPGDVQSLSDGFYYKAPDGWRKLEPITMAGGGLKHVGKMLVPGLTPQMVWTFRGAQAPAQITDKRPIFYVKELPALPEGGGRTGRSLWCV